MLFEFCAQFVCGGDNMDKKQIKPRVETDQDDQYSRPVCRPRNKPSGEQELGPNTTQLLGILKTLQGDGA